MSKITISLAQITSSNNLKKNYLKHFHLIEETKADIMVFPECSLVGYDLPYIAKEMEKICEGANLYIKELNTLCLKKGKLVIVGAVVYKNEKFYNASLVLGLGEIVELFYGKRSLTEDEVDVFTPGDKGVILEAGSCKLGLLICRDQSFPQFFAEYAQQSVSCVLIQAAHYYPPNTMFKKRDKNIAIPIVRAMDNKFYVAKVNAVGAMKNKISCGNSLVADPEGVVLWMLRETKEDINSFSI